MGSPDMDKRPGTLAEWAWWYADNGFAVFPLNPRDKNPYSRFAPHGFKNATTDAIKVSEWWRAKPDANIGIATGAMSGGLLVIDCDVDAERDEDGMRTLRKWEAEHGDLLETLSVVTGRGGIHYYYRTDRPIRCSKDETEDTHVGIDIRANGGYVTAPPSIHPNGRSYEWEDWPWDMPIADADENVLAFVAWVQANSKKQAEDGSTRLELPDKQLSGSRDNILFRYAASERARSVPKDVALAAARAYNAAHCEPPLDDATVVRKVESAYKYPAGGATDGMESATPAKPSGKKPTVAELVRYLAETQDMGASIGYDAFAQRRTVRGFLPWDATGEPRPWTPTDDVQAFAQIQQAYPKVSRQDVADALAIHEHAHEFDPLRDMMLDELPSDEHADPSMPYVHAMLVDLLGCKDSPYTRNAWATYMQGVFMRAVCPGWKLDIMPILYGRQGLGKSTFCKLLAIRPEWYLSGPRDLTDVANVARELSGRLIAEQEELAGMTKRDVEPLKAAITRTSDVFVDKYQSTPTERPRRAAFIGTTNTRQILRDVTGNRRYLLFECGVREPAYNLFGDEARAYVLAAWRELATAYRDSGRKAFTTYLDADTERQAELVREQFTETDDTSEAINSWLADQAYSRVCAAQVAQGALGLDRTQLARDRQLQRRIIEILDHRCPGWKRMDKRQRTASYGTATCWEREA